MRRVWLRGRWLPVVVGLLITGAQAQQAPPPAEGDAPTAAEREVAAEAALQELEGLSGADVIVVGRTAVVTGTADDPSLVDEAAALVRDTTGLTSVRNEITLSDDVGDRLRGAANRVSDRLDRWLAYLPLIPVAGAVMLVALLLAWLTGRWQAPYRRLTPNAFLQDIARRLAQATVLIGGVLVALEILDATALVGGVLGAAGVAGIAIGFAFRDLVENYIASILLSLRQPFRPRDLVLIDGHEGLVTSMNSRSTVLTTFDGNIVRIPNATVFKTAIINYSTDRRRRFTFEVNVGYDVDLAEAVDVGVATLLQTRGVLSDPAPFALVTRLGDSSITVQLFAWADQAAHDFGKVRSAALQRVKSAYDARDIDMPEPAYLIRLVGGTVSPAPGPARAEIGTPPPAPVPAAAPADAFDISRDDTALELAVEAERAAESENLLKPDAPIE